MNKRFLIYLPLLLLLPLLTVFPSKVTVNHATNSSVVLKEGGSSGFDGIEEIDGDYENADRYAKEFGKDDDSGITKSLNGQFRKYKLVVMFIFGMTTLTLLVVFMMSIVGLSTTGSANVVARSNAIKRIIICGIATALMGSFTLIFGLAFNFLK